MRDKQPYIFAAMLIYHFFCVTQPALALESPSTATVKYQLDQIRDALNRLTPNAAEMNFRNDVYDAISNIEGLLGLAGRTSETPAVVTSIITSKPRQDGD